jgi:adenylate cyclase
VPWTRDELELWTGRLERNDGAVGGQIVADQARLLSTAPDATPGPSGERGLDALSVRFLLAGARELERRGDLEGALVCRQRLAEMPGAEERWSRDLMVLLDQAGRLAEALRVYQVCRARLHRDHGRPPTPETDDLYATLLLQRDRDAAQREAAHLTVVFTDIVGSTRMAEEVGDRRWAVVVADHEELLGVHAVEFGGQVVKTQGDGAMIVFDRASHALAFAASVQRAVAVAGGDGPGLAVRIGMHSGDAVRHGHDYLGRTVITAARIMDQCGGGEVLVSEATRTSPGLEHLDFDGPRRVALKGLTGEMGVWRLLWAAVPS